MTSPAKHYLNVVFSPWSPRRGWREASTVRKGLAVALGPLLVASALIIPELTGSPDKTVIALLIGFYALVAPAFFYSAARVLRPHESGINERSIRHIIASGGMSMGIASLLTDPFWGLPASSRYSLDVVIVWGIPAAAVFAITVTWGLVAGVARMIEHRYVLPE